MKTKINFVMYDEETDTIVRCTASDTREECMFASIKFLTEDWSIDEWNEIFSQEETFIDVLKRFNYDIKRKTVYYG